MTRALKCILCALPIVSFAHAANGAAKPARPNIVFILADDHRYDAFSFMGHPYLQTPHLDRFAREGVHFKNAVVTTSLCSPSRASILTGLYAHTHGIVDNYTVPRASLVTFPQLLKKAGYETAFLGKWHMGESDAPQPGFDHWVSFRGQGLYVPDRARAGFQIAQEGDGTLNVDGKRVPQTDYITDELTRYALKWLDGRSGRRPFLLYFSHKAVHSPFVPAPRHAGRYAGKTFTVPATATYSEAFYADKPLWLKNRRNSRHGVDYGYYDPKLDLQALHRAYCETLLAIDESVGEVLAWLEKKKLLDSTIVVYMGDNGHHFGERGLVDKRDAYESSMRVPLLALAPGRFPAGRAVDEIVANIDVAPTLLEAAGLPAPKTVQGQSFLRLARGERVSFRPHVVYEYFWERNYPYTPTMHALRGRRWKYIRYYGLWDLDELYDLEADPSEMKNLAQSPAHKAILEEQKTALWQTLAATGGYSIPWSRDAGPVFPLRRKDGARPADFPKQMYEAPPAAGGAR